MNGKDILRGMQYLDEAYIEEAEFGPFSKEAFSRQTQPRRLNRILLIAAAIALGLLLVGCGIVYVLNMQNLKLGESLVDRDRWDNENHTMVSETVPQQVLTLSGLKGSLSYQAAQEWYKFESTYDPDHQIYFATKDSRPEFPEKYKFYSPYTQEMVDKIEAICAKYGLKLVGSPVSAQTADDMFEYLGVESLLLPGAPAQAASPTASYYEGGYFRSDFDICMEPGEGVWPYHSLMGYFYSPKDCFNDSLFKLEGDDWQERNYTTKSGHEVLILRSPTMWESWVFCDLPDATITIRMDTIHQVLTDEHGYQEVIETPMTDGQLDQILDTINFDLTFTPGDPAILEGQKMNSDLTQTQNGYTFEVKEVLSDGYRAAITVQLTAPEDVDLEQYLRENTDYTGSLSISGQRFEPLSDIHVNSGNGALNARPDDDGKANTVEFFGLITKHSEDGETFPQNGKANLFLNGLYANGWDEELLQFDTLWSQEGIWNFEITLEKGDWREIEFVSEPIEIKGYVGWNETEGDVFETVTLTSLKIRAFGGNVTVADDQYAELCDYRNDKFPALVLKDGSQIRLAYDLTAYDEKWEGKPYPLDEIDHLLLIDGTKLYPQE